MTERLVTWIIVWPFSMLSNLTGDIIVLIKTVVTDWLRSLYDAVYGNSVKKALSGFSTNKED